jgi:hypothetical protein
MPVFSEIVKKREEQRGKKYLHQSHEIAEERNEIAPKNILE